MIPSDANIYRVDTITFKNGFVAKDKMISFVNGFIVMTNNDEESADPQWVNADIIASMKGVEIVNTVSTNSKSKVRFIN